MKVKARTQKYRSLLLATHGKYVTYRGKALNPKDVEIVFPGINGGEKAVPLLEVFKVLRDNMNPRRSKNRTLLQKLFNI